MNHWHKFAHVRGILTILVAILSFSTAWAEDSYPEYITELKLVGGETFIVDWKTSILKEEGWTRIEQDLNDGAGGDYVYLFYKKSSRENPNGGYITDIIIRTSNEETYTTNGHTYYRVDYDGNERFKAFKGKVNSGTKQSSTDMWIYATKSNFSDKRAVDDIWFNDSKSGAVSSKDLNEGAGGDYIYMHFSTATKQNRPSSDPKIASSLTYNGNMQDFVWRDADFWNGTMYYRWSPNGSNMSEFDVKARDAGTYTVYYFAGPTDYASSSTLHSQKVTISKSPNNGVSVNIGASYPYGTSFSPSLSGTNLSTGSITYQYATSRDGTYSSTKPTSVGTHWVQAVIAGDDNCYKKITSAKSFKILPLIQNMTIAAIPAQTYTGSAICPTISIKDGSKTLYNGSDYTVSCYNNVSASSNAYAYISGIGNYAGSLNKYFEISPKSVQNFELVYDEHPIYTGSAICPDIVVKDGEKTLVQGTDYTVVCENNVNVGDKATIGVFGIGNYTGSSYGSFIVALKSIASQDVVVAATWEKAGSEYIPIVVVKDGEQTLQENVDYTVEVSVVDGYVNAIVNGLGIYFGTVQKNISEVHTVSVPEGFTIGDAYTTVNTVKYYKPGETYTLTVSKVNSVIDEITGVEADIASDKKSATFTMPNKDVEITAVMSEVYTVSVPEGLAISDAYATIGTKKYYKIGEAYTLTVSKVNSVIDEITGVEADIASDRKSATFTMPAKDVNIFATISKILWGGEDDRDGSKEHPYTIASAADLNLLAFAVNSGNDFTNTYFEVTENIVYDVTKTDDENNYTAIGDESHPFNGKFNGNGHTIKGIRIYKPNGKYQGLFGNLGEGAEVENVKLADVEIMAHINVGGVAGHNHGMIRKCTVEKTVKIKADNDNSVYKLNFGGIVGWNEGTVLGCISSASLTSPVNYNDSFGGIVGWNKGTVSGCTSFATLTSLGKINSGYGGIVGRNDYGTVSGCTSSATLIASGTESKYYGGIVGDDGHGTISRNFAKNVTVSGARYKGSVIGTIYYTKFSNNFYTACTIDGEENASRAGLGYDSNPVSFEHQLYGDVTENNGAVAVSFTAPVAAENLVYNKSSRNLVTAGKTNFGTLLYSLDGENYDTEIPTAVEAQSYTVYYKVDSDNGSVVDPQTIEVSIAPKKSVRNIELVYDERPVYTGSAICPDVIVKDGEKTLVQGTDYTVVCESATNVGEKGAIGIVGIGNYTDSQYGPVMIAPKSVQNFELVYDERPVYTGSAICPDVVVKDGEKTLVQGTDYTVECENNVNVGDKATIGVVGIGNYTGSQYGPVMIAPKSVQNFELVYDERPVYTGSAICPDVIVKDGEKTLVQGTDYTVECENNVNVGDKATIGVFGIGNYTDSQYGPVMIAPKSIPSDGILFLQVWDEEISGYIPVVLVNDGGKFLDENVDYTVEVSVVDGYVNAVVNGLGNYTESVQTNFSEVHTVSVPEGVVISDAYVTINSVKYYMPGVTYTLTVSQKGDIIDEISGVTSSNVEVKFDISEFKLRATFVMPSEDVEISASISNIWGDGDGSKEHPYTISTVEGLNSLAKRVNAGVDFENTYFEVIADIAYTYEGSEQENNYTAIGERFTRFFKGSFNGNGHTISGIRIYKPEDDFQGLFGHLRSGAVIENVKLDDVVITGKSYVGGIVGWNDGGTVSGCTSSAMLAGDGDRHGGIVGWNNGGTVSGCTSSAMLAGDGDRHGGIVGDNSGTVSGCTSTATLTGDGGYHGGIVGDNSGTVSGCTSTATLTGSGYFHGGIVGANEGTVSSCTSSATLIASGTESKYYGGIVGKDGDGTISRNFAKNVTVSADGYYGAVIGDKYRDTELSNNFYTACTVNGVENATNVGVGGKESSSDVTENNGAVAVSFTEPAAIENLVYNNSAQELVTAGEINFGTLLYSLDGESYSAEIPTAVEAQSYTVYYKVDSDNGSVVDPQTIEVSIAPVEVLVSDAVRFIDDQNGKRVEINAEYSGKEPICVPDAVAVDFVEVKRNLVPLTPATIVLPVQLPEGTTFNARFYYLKEVKQVGCSWNAVMKYIGSNNLPEPNTPYAVILNDGEDKLEFDLHGEQATVRTAKIADNWDLSNKWQFVGTYSYKVWEEGNDEIGLVYGFAGSNEDGIARGEFGRVKAGAYAVPMRSYLKKRDKDVRVTGCAQGIRANGAAYSAVFSNTDIIGVEFIDEEEQTTAIGRMNTRTGEFKIDRWYDLKGRKVDNVNRATKGAYYGKKVFKK